MWIGDPEGVPDDGWARYGSPEPGPIIRVWPPVVESYMAKMARSEGMVSKPPLMIFEVKLVGNAKCVEVVAHLAFNNSNRGEGLVFRRYYDDDVRTYVVAEFEPGSFEYFKEKTDGKAAKSRT